MPAINLNEAKANLSRLVDAAMAGEEIIIAKAGNLEDGREEACRRGFQVIFAVDRQ